MNLLDRIVRAPLWAHTILLVIVLVAFGWLARPGSAYTSDEGAALLQARLVNDTGSWLYTSPTEGLGLSDNTRPFLRAETGTKGVTPYSKHPLYVEVLRVADHGGPWGLAAVSIGGTVLAALGAAFLARSIRPSTAVATLWLVGVASPLLFDSMLLLAHTIAAASAVFAVVCARLWWEGRRWWRVGWLVGSVALIMATVMLRTEGLWLGPGVAVGAVWLGWHAVRRDRADGSWSRAALSAGALAAAALLATGAAWVLDRVWMRAIVGSPVPALVGNVSDGAAQHSWPVGRLQGIWATWFDTGYGIRPSTDLLLALACLAVVGAALLFRFNARAETWVRALVIGAAVCYVMTLLLAGVHGVGAIPGLALVFPVGVAGVLLVTPAVVQGSAPRLASATAVIGFAGVVATQYSWGGGLEWGGRYFAMFLPVVAPLATVSLALAAERRAAPTSLCRVVVAASVVSSLVLGVLAVGAVRNVHTAVEDVSAALQTAGAEVQPAPGLDRPIVVAWNPLLPQILYRDFDEAVWVVPQRADLAASLDALSAAGVDEVVFVTPDLGADREILGAWRVVGEPISTGSQQVAILALDDGMGS